MIVPLLNGGSHAHADHADIALQKGGVIMGRTELSD
jgi:hypothetical protein